MEKLEEQLVNIPKSNEETGDIRLFESPIRAGHNGFEIVSLT